MKHKRWWIWSLLAILTLLGAGLGGGQPASPVVAQGQGLELAVYNQDLALVKDRRSMDLAEGLNEVRFTNVASRIDPTSVHFRSLADPEGTVVLEQKLRV